MKPIITGFFDRDQKLSLEEQLEFAKSKQLTHIAVKKIEDFALGEIDQKTYQHVIQTTKKYKLKYAILDPHIKTYDLYDEKKHSEAIEIYKDIFLLANKLKASYIALRLPKFTNVIDEIELIDQKMSDYLKLAQQHHRKYVFMPASNHKGQTYAYLLRKYKTNLFNMCFDPVYFLKQKESTTITYRLLKKHIEVFIANDANIDGEPKLLGYGKTDFVKISKRLIRDNFSGYILLDNQFSSFMKEDQTTEKKPFFKRLFSNEKKKKEQSLLELKSKLFPHQDLEEKNVTYDDILDNQIKVLEIIFK